MEFKDYYDILGVAEDADKADIKKAYRKLARKYHPDVSKEKDAESQFKEVAEAFEVLGNDERRAEYDQLRKYGRKGESFTPPPGWTGAGQGGRAGGGGFEFADGGDFSEFFSSIFGGGGFGRAGAHARSSRGFDSSEDFYSRRGQDVEIDLPVFLEDTLRDEQKTISYKMPKYDGSGAVTEVKKTLKVKIPKGVVDGERIRLKGQGGPGFGKGAAGDLYLRIKLVPHPLYDVVGHDLHLTLPIAPWEAALGAKITVPTLTGKISLTIDPGSQTGKRMRVKGKGLPAKTDQGDLYVILKVVMPEKIDDKSKALWEQLKDTGKFDPREELRRQSA
ncbi:MAG: DnaJ C-terminal domain-containing protein [Pseudohongiellaceae bacterium]